MGKKLCLIDFGAFMPNAFASNHGRSHLCCSMYKKAWLSRISLIFMLVNLLYFTPSINYQYPYYQTISKMMQINPNYTIF